MFLEILIGTRYLKHKGKKGGLVSFMSWVSILGIFLGVLVPIIVMSVLGGFQKEIREKILGVNGHLTLTPKAQDSILYDQKAIDKLKSLPGVQSVIPIIESQGLMQTYGEYKPVLIRGLDQSTFKEDPDFAKLFVITDGTNDLSKRYYFNIGNELAKNHWLQVGDRLEIITAKNLNHQESSPKTIKGLVKGVFKTGYLEYDNGVLFTSMITLQKAFNMEGRCHEIQIKCRDEWELQPLIDLIQTQFPDQFFIYTWKTLNSNLFKALVTEKVIMRVIVFFIYLVAVFNVMSGQIMLVLDKKREIGILKSLGFSPKKIAAIFLVEGLITTLIGATLGTILGLLAANNIGETLAFIEKIIDMFQQSLYYLKNIFIDNSKPAKFSFFPEGIYYLDAIPVNIQISQIVFIYLGSLVLSLLAGLVPALKAAWMKPLEILRNE